MKLTLFAAVVLLLPLAVPGLAQAQGDGSATGPAQPDETANQARLITFYPHVFAATGPFPMPGNTQFPVGETDFSAGYPGNGCYPQAAKPLEPVPAVPLGSIPGGFLSDADFHTCDTWTNNVLYVYSTAGFVHADADTWTYADFHNERGQAKDILLDTTQDITATFYMSADYHPWVCGLGQTTPGVPSPWPCWNWDPGFFPKWQVEATLFLGSMGEYQGQPSDAPPVEQKVASGDVIEVAKGQSEPQDMLSLDSSLNQHGEVYEFNINLGKPKVDKIPREMDWIMQFRWWIRNGEDTFLPGQRLNWNLNSGEFYPNRFVLPVKNPFDVELVYPQFLHDKLLVHAMLNSPWGSYDVDSKSVKITVTGDGNAPADMIHFDRYADFSVAHGGHYKPVNITWVWDYKADKPRPGTYKVEVEASNFQHSAASKTTASFRINPDGSGTVLSVGRSGQQTFTDAQLKQVEAAAGGGTFDVASSGPASVKGTPGFEPAAGVLAFSLAAVALAIALPRRIRL